MSFCNLIFTKKKKNNENKIVQGDYISILFLLSRRDIGFFHNFFIVFLNHKNRSTDVPILLQKKKKKQKTLHHTLHNFFIVDCILFCVFYIYCKIIIKRKTNILFCFIRIFWFIVSGINFNHGIVIFYLKGSAYSKRESSTYAGHIF